VGIFLEEYRRSPQMRPALGRLIESISSSPEYRAQAKAQRESSLLEAVLKDVLTGYEISYGLFFSRGFVKSFKMANEAKGFRRILIGMKNGVRSGVGGGVDELKVLMKNGPAQVTIGVASFDVAMIYEGANRLFATVKVDPRIALEALQIEIVYDQNWAQLNEVRGELQLIDSKFSIIGVETIRGMLRSSEAELNRILAESEQLLREAPQLGGRHKGFSHQLINTGEFLQKLYLRLGEAEDEDFLNELRNKKNPVIEVNSCESDNGVCVELQ
jgi:hypothetical protein